MFHYVKISFLKFINLRWTGLFLMHVFTIFQSQPLCSYPNDWIFIVNTITFFSSVNMWFPFNNGGANHRIRWIFLCVAKWKRALFLAIFAKTHLEESPFSKAIRWLSSVLSYLKVINKQRFLFIIIFFWNYVISIPICFHKFSKNKIIRVLFDFFLNG